MWITNIQSKKFCWSEERKKKKKTQKRSIIWMQKEKFFEMAWKFSGSTEFDLNAGRNAFRSDTSIDDWESAGK